MSYIILEERTVKFEPRGAMAELDYSKAIEKLNLTESAEELNWKDAKETAGEGYEARGVEIDLVIGTLNGKVEAVMGNAAFLAKSMDENLDMKIQIIDNPNGKQLKFALDNEAPGLRFTANLEMDESFVNPVAFNRFFIVVDQVVETLPPPTSSLIILS